MRHQQDFVAALSAFGVDSQSIEDVSHFTDNVQDVRWIALRGERDRRGIAHACSALRSALAPLAERKKAR